MSSTAKIILDTKFYNPTNFYLGLCLAITSSGFIGASFIIKKKALIRLERRGALRASSGGFGYLREWTWWTGLISMGIGEAANFSAYMLAPASLVSSLGALSILVSAVLASKFLNEQFNLFGKIGCLLCIVGSAVLVLHSPKGEDVHTLNELFDKLKDPGSIIYISVIIICSCLIIFFFGPAYGKQNILVYICLCSSLGSLTVISCKGFGLALKETIGGINNGFTNWITWGFLFSIILCVSVQMNYLNRSLDLFQTTVVTPIYYVFFTLLVTIASAVLFREWENMTLEDILGSSCGFVTVIIAIFLLNSFNRIDVHYKDIRHILKSKRQMFVNKDHQWNDTDEESLTRFLTELRHNHGAQALARTV